MPVSKEEAIIQSIEAGEWTPASNSVALKKKLRATAKTIVMNDQRKSSSLPEKTEVQGP